MAKNTGKSSEAVFEASFARCGKDAYLYRFVDASEIRGRAGVIATSVRPAPSDYLLVYLGVTEFAEVKSTNNLTSFPFSLLRKTQSAAAQMALAAGGRYFVYIHSLTRNEWFRIPYSLILEVREAGKASIPWSDLKEFEWNP